MKNYPSVTQIISYCNQGAFASVPDVKLQLAQERGIDVHALAASHALGMWLPEIPPQYEGYVKSATEWFERSVKAVIKVEEQLVDPKLGFTGTPDLIVRMKGDPDLTVVDWKTPKALSKTWRLQLAAYRHLAEIACQGYSIRRVASLRIREDGGPAIFDGYSRTLFSDLNIFLGLLNYFKYMEGNRGRA